MSFANGRFRSELTEDENMNPRGPLQRSYPSQKMEMKRLTNEKCNQNKNLCVKYFNLDGSCECQEHVCKQSDDGSDCIYSGPLKTSPNYKDEVLKVLEIIFKSN